MTKKEFKFADTTEKKADLLLAMGKLLMILDPEGPTKTTHDRLMQAHATVIAVVGHNTGTSHLKDGWVYWTGQEFFYGRYKEESDSFYLRNGISIPRSKTIFDW